MTRKPYIGITDFTDPEQVDRMFDVCFRNNIAALGRRLSARD